MSHVIKFVSRRQTLIIHEASHAVKVKPHYGALGADLITSPPPPPSPTKHANPFSRRTQHTHTNTRLITKYYYLLRPAGCFTLHCHAPPPPALPISYRRCSQMSAAAARRLRSRRHRQSRPMAETATTAAAVDCTRANVTWLMSRKCWPRSPGLGAHSAASMCLWTTPDACRPHLWLVSGNSEPFRLGYELPFCVGITGVTGKSVYWTLDAILIYLLTPSHLSGGF